MSDAESLGKEVFTIAFKGYARDEVDAFMKNVATRDRQLRDEVEQALEDKEKIKREIEGLQTIVNAAKASGQKWEGRLQEMKSEVDRLRSEVEAARRERDSYQALAEKLAAQTAVVGDPAMNALPADVRLRLTESINILRSLALEARDRTSDVVARLEELAQQANG